MLYSLYGEEVMAVGTWNGIPFTIEKLDRMAKNFNATKHLINPYIKLGHNDEQELLERDDLPVGGFFSNVYREGDKLKADFIDIPHKLYLCLKAGAYRWKSLEVISELTHPQSGEKYEDVISAIAFLGGKAPAVKNLNDILDIYGSGRDTWRYAEKVEGELKPTVLKLENQNFSEGDDSEMEKILAALEQMETKMTQKFTDQFANLTKQVDTINTRVGELEKPDKGDEAKPGTQNFAEEIAKAKADLEKTLKEQYSAQITTLENTVKELSTSRKIDSLQGFFDNAKAKGKINPAMETQLKALFASLADSNTLKFTDADGKEQEVGQVQMLQNIINQIPDNGVVSFAELSKGGDQEPKSSELTEEEIQKYADEHKVDYGTAYEKLSKERSGK